MCSSSSMRILVVEILYFFVVDVVVLNRFGSFGKLMIGGSTKF
jgi:hypothetical protein